MSYGAWEPVIGLEVHAQLLTRTKIFCGCGAAFGAPPNSQTCPICLGHPGVLPALNREVVHFAIKTGLALGCAIQSPSRWARKHYFYPDLPKGYQISQFELPLCKGGGLTVDLPGGGSKLARLVRIHMEEDAGKNLHDPAGGDSLVDLNRAGVPLMEIVGEPDLRSPDEASEYLKGLRAILMYLGVNDGNMEEGSFRCDANVSVRKVGAAEYGTRTELKNMNSFRFVRQAIDFEIKRQIRALEDGGRVVQETRLWDAQKGETRPMRSKEEAHDYRYFPEPDLPPLAVDAAWIERARAELPELPRARAERYVARLGLSAADARSLTAERGLSDLFEEIARAVDPRKAANWCLGEVSRLGNEGVKVGAAQVIEVIRAVDAGEISLGVAKDVLDLSARSGKAPREVVAEKGLAQVSDSAAVEAAADRVIAASPDELAKYKAGKTQLFGFFVGKVMKEMKGKGNPAVVNDVLRNKLAVIP